MHVLFLMDQTREFDPGNDLLLTGSEFLTWRNARQRTPNGFLYATVHRSSGHWDLRPLGGSHKVFFGIDSWLDRQLRDADNLGVYSRTDFGRVLKPVDSRLALLQRRSLMNRFMKETYGLALWCPTEPEPLSMEEVFELETSMCKRFTDDLLRLQSA